MATSYLTKLPVEIQCQILDLVLCPDEEDVIENPIFDSRIFDLSPPLVNSPTTLLDVSVLDTCKSLRTIGFHVLYTKNRIRFTSPHDARNFICHPKASNHQRLIRYLELEIDVIGPYRDDWAPFFRGNFMQGFRVKRLDIHFPSFRYPGAEGLVLAEDHPEFTNIQQALVDKVRVAEVCVSGLSGYGDYLGEYLEHAMTGFYDRVPVEGEENSVGEV